MTPSSAPDAAFRPHDHARCRGAALAAVEAACRARRLRLTPARACVLEALLESHRAMTAYELLERLAAAGLGRQPPVVYRALEFLTGNGFAHRIERLGAYVACTQGGAAHPAAFLICRGCRTVAETALPRAARAGRRGGGGRVRHRAGGGGGRGALRRLPRRRMSPAADRGAGRRGDPRRAAGAARRDARGPRGRDRHHRRAERLGQEHAPAAPDRGGAAGRGPGGPGAGPAHRLRAAAAGDRPHPADHGGALPGARRRRRGGRASWSGSASPGSAAGR